MTTPEPTRWVMTYHSVPDFLPLAQEHYPAHSARLDEFHVRGLVLMAGPLTDPFDGDALAIFTSREAVEEFIAGDPFVTEGVVASWTIRPWIEAFSV